MDRLPILVSYWYSRQIDWDYLVENEKEVMLLIDCGEFSAFQKGLHVNLDEYLNFIEKLQKQFSSMRFMALDSIGNQKKTLENLREIRKRGFNPVPIFTRSSDFSPLDEMYSGSDLVALGGLGSGGKNDDGYVKFFMNQNKGRRIHWLGFSKERMVNYYKPYSIDNSEWVAVLRFGTLTLWDEQGKIRISRKNFNSRECVKYFRLIENLGYDPSLLLYEENWRGSLPLSIKITMRSFIKFIDRLGEKTGTIYYPVVNDSVRIKAIIEEFRSYSTPF